MAITKLISPSTPNPLPPAGAGGDWDKAMAQLTAVKKLLSGEQMILTQWTNATTAPALAEGSYLQHMGAIYVVDTEDYALPALSVDGTYYIKLTISGETLVPSYIASLTGFSWSAQHNGLYNASDEQVLPYQVVKAGASIAKYRVLNSWQSSSDFVAVDYLGHIHGVSLGISGAASIDGNTTIGGTLDVTGAISGASVGFTSLNPNNSVEISVSLSPGSTYILPKGAYAIRLGTLNIECQMQHGSSWHSIFPNSGGFVISDGVNFRLSHTGSTSTYNILMRKW